MMWMVSAMLLVAWLVGMVKGTGSWVHVFLIAAVASVLLSLVRPNRLDTI
jgi:hypothetical protein